MAKRHKELPVRELAVIDQDGYEQSQGSYSPGDTGPDPEETMNTEWTEDTSQRGSWRDRFSQAGEHFSTRARERFEARAERERLRIKHLHEQEEHSEEEQITMLRADIRDAGRKYMESLKASDVLVPGFTHDERSEELDVLHAMYAQMMVQSCMRPLHEGTTAKTVVQATSMMAAMYMLSPNFRDTVGEHLNPVKEAIRNKIDHHAEAQMNWAEAEAGRKNSVIESRNERIREQNRLRKAQGKEPKPLLKEVDARSQVSKRWLKRYDDMQFRKRGNREPFTERSAAMTEVALMEQAFEKMREPGADRAGISKNYRAMVANLYNEAVKDGLSRHDVATTSQVVLGERIAEDPRLATMVEGLSHGGVRMSDPHEERVSGTDKVVKVWRGEFENARGEKIDLTRYQDKDMKAGVQGAFTMRAPMDLSAHRAHMAQTMADTMAQAIESGDAKAFNTDMAAYMIGYQAKANDFDGEGLPGSMPERLATSRTMLASMTVDGIDPQDQRLAYSHAYVDAIEALQEAYPQFAEQWGQTYGEDWQSFMHDAVADPHGAYQTWQERESAGQYGSSGAPRPSGSRAQEKPQTEDEPQYA